MPTGTAATDAARARAPSTAAAATRIVCSRLKGLKTVKSSARFHGCFRATAGRGGIAAPTPRSRQQPAGLRPRVRPAWFNLLVLLLGLVSAVMASNTQEPAGRPGHVVLGSSLIFKGLRLMVHTQGHMRTHVLRAHVTRHGGEVIACGSGEATDALCCDKGTPLDKMQELWGQSPGEMLALNNLFITKSVLAQKRMNPADFVLRGTATVLPTPAQPPALPAEPALGKRGAVTADEARQPKKLASIFNRSERQAPPMVDVADAKYMKWWSSEFVPSAGVAAFDLDHTLITPMSGNVHPKDENDWKLMNQHDLKRKLKSLVASGKCIVIVSNQASLDRDGKKTALEGKVKRVQQALDVPLAFYCCYAKVHRNRKPAPGLWERVTHDFAEKGVVVDKQQSFYCGDAAGRPEGTKRWAGSTKQDAKKDFADTDRRFAINAGLEFFTPEQLFFNEDPLALAPSACPGLDPRTIKRHDGNPYDSIRVSSTQELVILVGYPGSGKSSLARAVFASQGYTRVNLDTLKTQEKCLKTTSEALHEGKSVVIDNTNPDVDSRKRYVDAAKRKDVPVRCVWVSTPREVAEHLNVMRTIAGTCDHPVVPDHAFKTFSERFVEPKVEEGFGSVIRWEFAVGSQSFKEGEGQIFEWYLQPWKIPFG